MKRALLFLCVLAGCTSVAPAAKPIMYPWLCKQESAGGCYRLGYIVKSDDPAYVTEQSHRVCPEGVFTYVLDHRRGEALIVCSQHRP